MEHVMKKRGFAIVLMSGLQATDMATLAHEVTVDLDNQGRHQVAQASLLVLAMVSVQALRTIDVGGTSFNFGFAL
jgi:acetolactate synthase regulatory subunit